MADKSHGSSNTLKAWGKAARLCRFVLAALALPIPIAAADVVTSAPSNAAVTLWDQPNGTGHSISFTGTGSVYLANFPLDPANPGLGTWNKAVRSYKANDTVGSLRKTPPGPARSERFGPNFNVKNAGSYGRVASQLILSWKGWNQYIQSGSIVSWGNDFIPGAPSQPPFCMDTLPGHMDDLAIPLVILADCSWTSAASQRWQWVNGLLRNVGTGQCMDGSGQLNGVHWMLVVKPCSADPSYRRNYQTFSFDSQRKLWMFAGINNPITVFGGWPPSFGETLNVQYPIDSDWDQVWLNYFY
jgi:hypothetical protein